jgi:hypothetical protein
MKVGLITPALNSFSGQTEVPSMKSSKPLAKTVLSI